MEVSNHPLPEFLTQTPSIGNEISITGKWEATSKSRFFTKSGSYKNMIQAWDDIHQEASAHDGILSTEISPAIGQEAVLIHHTFRDADSVQNYFSTVADAHEETLIQSAKPGLHLVRGLKIDSSIQQKINSKNVIGAFGEYLFGYVKHDNRRPNPNRAIQVTAKWTCKDKEALDELKYWWQQVGTDAYSMELGLVRFEVYQVIGEDALIIHETFETNDDLQFHLTKGTAAKYKAHIDNIAFPENYFFRGPVSWLIRTYSKFMHLPATYTGIGRQYIQAGGTNSDGITESEKIIKMENQIVTVVYKWTAKEGKSEELRSIYREVESQMKANEPGALDVQCHFDEDSSTLVVIDVFADANAVGFHLGTTAAGHFNNLLEIAQPGEFLFCGDVPEEMKQAAVGMGLNATFAPRAFGFSR